MEGNMLQEMVRMVKWNRATGLLLNALHPTYRLVALKPNEEEKNLERWVSSLEYLTKQQNVEDRHTLQRKGIHVFEPMTDNIPKDVKVYENLEQILELGMKEDGKILDEDYAAAYGTPGPSVEVYN
ncbi:hypothetical protein L1987_33694 [Smallanthus sonchifolius]|uniref:Uncharacterized protein n=1 Tax=Smallanthus sonchifolius TaxID=185202 RepID=A0ACB9HRJ9_9ASTR|nr:hypothetical protein L1987_33694 [Smallanthus sonchifolius]